MAAFEAGKHVFCEKTLGITIDECYKMYHKHLDTGRVFFSGQQRLFDPRYIKVMELVHAGTFGDIEGIRAYWFRNGDWRRPVPSPELERLINWRLYKEHSKGLMTELACHQIQVGSWALRQIPNRVMGHGAITYWKDGREVDDNVSCIYVFDNGVKLTYESIISNKFYGLEEQILGHLGTVEPEKRQVLLRDHRACTGLPANGERYRAQAVRCHPIRRYKAGRRRRPTKTTASSSWANARKVTARRKCWMPSWRRSSRASSRPGLPKKVTTPVPCACWVTTLSSRNAS